MSAPLSVIMLTEGNSEIKSYRVCGVVWLSGIVMVTYVCSQADRHHFLETMYRRARTKKPAGNIIKPDSLAACLAPGLRLTSDELLQEFIRTCAETAEQSSAALLSPLHMTQVRHEQRPISCPELG